MTRVLGPEELGGVPTLELLNELKRRHNVLSRPPLRAALVGPPCAGKHTQAELLRRDFGACHISAAELFGGSNASGDAGALQVLEAKLEEPRCRRGFVLEGFPTTVAQADGLQTFLGKIGRPLEHVVLIDAELDTLTERCKHRLVHQASGRRYNTKFAPPQTEGIDDFTGESLSASPYNEAEFSAQLQKSKQDTGMLRQWFDKIGIVRPIDGKGEPSAVGKRIMDAVLAPKAKESE
eukprot:gnl/MRDRNA2_/MRDRNA2_81177_c0_seq1.p1 gnl/MRDRNA2_/MRDRNA2_81177_c0~~gnl/MRDRNA2_/MRDRNA2_81177_c0_seq1.p1  ORF type:complete len:236 (-),score=41.38 gnl/MRDRNA2_/MRDRNA2_81177_c0_seq1:236-943(-)